MMNLQNIQDYKMNEGEKQTAIFLFISALDNLKWYRKKFYKKCNLEFTFKDFNNTWKESTYEEKSDFLKNTLTFDYDSGLVKMINLMNIYQNTDENLSMKQRRKEALRIFQELNK